jgi:hypothetical protein
VRFRAGDSGFTVTLGEKKSHIKLRIPQGDFEYVARSRLRAEEPFTYDISDIDFVLRVGLRSIIEALPEEQQLTIHRQMNLLSDLFRVFQRSLPREIFASAPVRSKPERTYNPAEATPSPEGEHIPFVLAQIQAFDKEWWTRIETTLAKFGKASGLFDAISIRRLSRTPSGPFQIIVDLDGSKSKNLIDVGYGISQILPILTDVLRAPTRSIFLLQQPEVHLHPKAQAELASFFIQSSEARRHTFVLETHSDYLIDRVRMAARDGKVRPEDVSILYFDRQGRNVVVHPLRIDHQGHILDAPEDYRRFFLEEALRSVVG